MSNPSALAIDLSTAGNSTLEAALAFGILGLVGLLLLIGKWRVEYRGLPDDQKRHAKALIGQLESQTPTSLSWRPSELTDGDHGRSTVREALAATPGADVQADRATMRQATREISAAWSAGIASLTTRVPALAVRLLTLAGGIAVFGPIAVYALDSWRAAVQGRSGLQFGVFVDALTQITATFADTAVALVLRFPFIGDLWALAFSTVIIIAEAVYTRPLATALMLVGAAVAVTLLDRRLVTSAEFRRDRVRTITVPRVFGTTVGLWALGVAPTAVGTLLGYPRIGATVGLTMAVVAGLGAVLWAAREFAVVLRREARLEWPSDPDTRVVAWIISKRAAAALIAVGAVLVPAYILNVLLTGRLGAFLGILAGARIEIKALLVILAALLGIGAVYRARGAWSDLRVALGDLTKDRSVKLALFGSGMPFLALGAVYWFMHSTTDSTPIALLAALIAGVIARSGYLLLRALRYRASLLETEDTAPMRVVAHCYQLEDADGRVHYLVRVNGTDLAHRDPDALADAVADAHRDILNPDTTHIRASVAKQYASHLQSLGIVHVESDSDNTPSTIKKLNAEMERRTYGGLKRANDQMRVEDLRDVIGDLPPEIVESELDRYQIEGTREGTVVIDDGYAWRV